MKMIEMEFKAKCCLCKIENEQLYIFENNFYCACCLIDLLLSKGVIDGNDVKIFV